MNRSQVEENKTEVTPPPAYGWYPQMKAECITFSEEKQPCLVIGTNPGFQNAVLVAEEVRGGTIAMNDQMGMAVEVAPTLEARDYKGAIMVTECFRKTTHPKRGGQGWEPTMNHDTLNCNDIGESRVPVVVVEPIGCDIYNLKVTGAAVSITAEGHTSTGSGPKVLEPIPLENHPADSRVKISDDGKCQTLSSRMGTGGGNTPMILEPIILDNAKQHSSVSEGTAPSLLKQMGEGVNNVPIVVETPPPPTYTMKVRGGVAVDSNGKAAGKGALIQTEKAGCIGAVQDQFLFQPSIVLNDQGGGQMSITQDRTGTLRAQEHGHPPIVMIKADE